MLEIVRPGFLWAGGALALVPLVLHLIRPRIRERRELPTARFLREDPASRLRVHRRPDHLLLLALRMSFALLLGAAFAGMSWIGSGQGVATVVVVDASGEADDRDRLEARATELAGAGGEVVMVAREDGSAPTMADLLRELRRTGGGMMGVDSVEAIIVTTITPAFWVYGLPVMHEVMWPGSIRLETLGPEDPRDPAGVPERSPTGLTAPHASEEFADRLTRVWETLPASSRTDLRTQSGDPIERVELVFVPEAEDLWIADRGWGVTEAIPGGQRDLLLLDGRRLPGGGAIVPGQPAAGATIPLLRSGGIPGGATTSADGLCRIALAIEERAPVLQGPDLPTLVESVVREGCGLGPGPGREAVEQALRTLLDDPELPTRVAVADLREPGGAGSRLAPWFLALAFLVGLAELLRTRHVDRSEAGGARI